MKNIDRSEIDNQLQSFYNFIEILLIGMILGPATLWLEQRAPPYFLIVAVSTYVPRYDKLIDFVFYNQTKIENCSSHCSMTFTWDREEIRNVFIILLLLCLIITQSCCTREYAICQARNTNQGLTTPFFNKSVI